MKNEVKKKKNQDKNSTALPEKYEAPVIESEDLLAFAATCNGTTNGSRKANVGGPNFCLANRLNS